MTAIYMVFLLVLLCSETSYAIVCSDNEKRCSENRCIGITDSCDCPIGFKQCNDGRCVMKEYWLDKCTEDACPVTDPFECDHKSKCLELHKVCDGNQHCIDNSDENGCDNSKSNAFTSCNYVGKLCPDGRCIPTSMSCICNAFSEKECPDGRCISTSDSCNCPTGFKSCYNGECVDKQRTGRKCPEDSCPSYKGFECKDGRQCVSYHEECDGVMDCDDGSDENSDCHTNDTGESDEIGWFGSVIGFLILVGTCGLCCRYCCCKPRSRQSNSGTTVAGGEPAARNDTASGPHYQPVPQSTTQQNYSTSYEMTPAGTRVTPSVPTSIAPSAPPAPAPSAPPAPAPSAPPAYHVALDINAYPAVKPDEIESPPPSYDSIAHTTFSAPRPDV